MKFSIYFFLIFFKCFSVVAVTNDISEGIVVNDTFKGLAGKLIYLQGRFPEKGANEMPASIWCCDLTTKSKRKLLDIKEAGDLIVSLDGMWIGVIVQNRGKISVYRSGELACHEYSFSAEEDVQAVIVNGWLCVRSGARGKQRISLVDLDASSASALDLVHTSNSVNILKPHSGYLPDDNSIFSDFESHDKAPLYYYAFLATRMSDTNNLFIGCCGGLNGGPDGLYKYDVFKGGVNRIGDFTDFCDYSSVGEAVKWKQVLGGWAVVTYKVTFDANKSIASDKGRVVARFFENNYNLSQLSPCLRYALVEQRFQHEVGIDVMVYICDLATGTKKLLVDARPSRLERGAFVGRFIWVR